MSWGVESNTAEVVRELENQINELDPFLGAVIDDAANDTLREIKDSWPTDSGRSREGWQLETEGLAAVIANTVDYSEYVHGGRAAAEAEAIFEDNMDAELAEELEDASAELLNS